MTFLRSYNDLLEHTITVSAMPEYNGTLFMACGKSGDLTNEDIKRADACMHRSLLKEISGK